MTAVAVVLVLAVALWPATPRAARWLGAPDQDGPETAPGVRVPVTTTEVADATVLVAIALRSGSGLVDALEHAARVCSVGAGEDLLRVAAALRWGRPMRDAWGYARPVWRPTARALTIAEESGAASAETLLTAAAALREEEGRRLEAAGGRAGVMLVLPLGLCFLPAFVATAVVPLVAVLIDSSLG